MSAASEDSANQKLIKNLENQLERLVAQLRDLEECKDDLPLDEYNGMKEETVDQIKEFTETLERMNKGDVTIENKLSTMITAIRKAISSSFNTIEIIKLFGANDVADLEQRLVQLDDEYRRKRITLDELNSSKASILTKLQDQGHTLSTEDRMFLDSRGLQYLQQMENVAD